MAHFTLKATSAAVALALCSQANAFVDPLTAQVRLYISGATAPSHMIREQTIQNLCDSTQAIDVFVDQANVAPGPGGSPILNHNTHWVVQCIGRDGTSADNLRLLVAKSDPGGSAQGVNPVALGTTRPFLNTAVCAGAPLAGTAGNGTTNYTYRVCGATNLINQIPDFGVSDIEPDKFTGQLNDPVTGDFGNAPANWQVEIGPGLLFGVVVTTAFRNELQEDQIANGYLPGSCAIGDETEACMPDLPSWYVRSVFANKINNWNTEEVKGGVINIDAGMNGRVHICRRVQGSGTHAQHQLHFARTNCNRAATLPMPNQPGGALGAAFVFENTSSGAVDQCLAALQNGTGTTGSNTTPNVASGVTSFGIGYQSLEKNAGATPPLPYRFVKIDNVAPTLENAWNGDYTQVYFLSYNHRENDFRTGPQRASFNTGEVAAIESLIDTGFDISPAVAAQINQSFVHSFGQSGFLVPVLPAAAPTAYNPANPAVPFARRNAANSGPDSCAPIYRR